VKLIVALLVKKSFAIYTIQKFITVFTETRKNVGVSFI